MRNYVIINGVNSLTIKGLAINELPSISKPKMRSKREEIDGRNGDTITKLGYSAYDKDMTIGLYGDYDINEVIAFFNQEGTITFSNEDDKYYNFTILDHIDYDSLLKFRTATISFHCQPFKYLINESPIVYTTTGTKTITNVGNIYASPILALEGTGNVQLYLDNVQLFEVDLTTNNKITIDIEKMEAYNPDDNLLMNRMVTGDYDNFKLMSGSNSLKIQGSLTKLTITKYTRFL